MKFLGAMRHMKYDNGIGRILLLRRADDTPTMPEGIEASMRRLL